MLTQNSSLKWSLAKLQAASKKNNHGILLGYNPVANTLIFGKPQRPVLLLGPTRSGKTSSVIIPSIIAANGPVVTTSTKLDVMKTTLLSRSILGRCFFFDPLGIYSENLPEQIIPLSFSPLQGCKTWEGSLLTAFTLAKSSQSFYSVGDNSHWIERAQSLLAPVMYACAISNASMESVASAIFAKDLKRVASILESLPDGLPAMSLKSVLTTSDRELASIFSTASNIIGAYKSREALNRARHPNFDPARFIFSSDTLYIATPSESAHLSAPIISCLIEIIKREAFRKFNISNELQPPVYLALDELANTAPIASFEQLITEGGGQNIITLACFQDLSHAARILGPPPERFLNIFPLKAIFPGIMDLKTLKILSELSGEKEVKTLSYHRSLSLLSNLLNNKYCASCSVTSRKEPLLKVNDISKIPNGWLLLHSENESPKLIAQTRFFSHPILKGLCLTPNLQLPNVNL